ncbi:hypothetical protein [Sinorhizobium medicae]|uniref:hypothetical protein n=1 Tax=Sinorhizobium medicae TaxID=110321 RepID=UPI000C7C3949|nr:hypothetical protein [Sinorhizobium medicae]PLU58138.1 hypothetical protein BMJ23_06635 [Sinorhizobium medicae]PLU71957.1 hypothetical protein BMJ21_09135 [Sinorhizobium medicae]
MNTIETFIKEKLQGGLWHTTNPERLETILKDGFIKVEPNLLDSDRWGTARGPAYYPFVRYIGGVSLFEFPPDFDVAAYEKEIPTASLGQFIPFRPSWGRAVWLKVDRAALDHRFLSGKEVRQRWNESQAYRHKFIAELEAAYLGDLSMRAISKAFLVEGGKQDWSEIDLRDAPRILA